jgi:hypothetical protein
MGQIESKAKSKKAEFHPDAVPFLNCESRRERRF